MYHVSFLNIFNRDIINDASCLRKVILFNSRLLLVCSREVTRHIDLYVFNSISPYKGINMSFTKVMHSL